MRVATFTAALVAVSSGQSSWDGSTKPRMESTDGNLEVHSWSDVTFNLRGSGTSHGIASVLSHIKNQVLADNCPQGQAVIGFNNEGVPLCASAVPPTFVDDVSANFSEIRRGLSQTCQLSAWSSWGTCDSTCDGTQTRNRTIIREATNSVPCSEYKLEERRNCGPACPAAGYSGCGNNEKWYYLNSGREAAFVMSYVAQTVIFRRPHHIGHGSQSGGGGSGRAFKMSAGQRISVSPNAWGLADASGFAAGDYFCGTEGNIEVHGRQGSNEREWIPARLAGTQFLIPATRANPQHVQIMALREASVSIYEGTNSGYRFGLELAPGDISRYQGSRQGKSFKFNSTAPVLVAYVGGGSSTFVAPSQLGGNDYMPVAPTASELFGIPSTGWAAAWVDRGRTTINRHCSNRNFTTRTDDAERVKSLGSTGGHYSGHACRLWTPSNVQLGASSVGDGDGGDATFWMPRTLFRRKFLIPVAVQHIAMVCIGGGQVQIRPRMTTGNIQRAAIRVQNRIGRLYLNARRAAGTYVFSPVPCMMVVDGAVQGQELSIFGSD